MTSPLPAQTAVAKPGLHPGITPATYFAECCPAPALTNSGMGALLNETPADFAYNHPALNPDPEVRKATLAMRQGDVTHQLALGKGRGYAIFDGLSFAHKGGKEFKEQAEQDGLTPIAVPKFAECEKMADVLRARIRAELDAIAVARGIAPAQPYQTEVVFAWQEITAHGPIWCRGMLDVWCPSLMVALDPKITKLLHNRIRPQMEAQGWDRQGVWYERGLNAIFPQHAGRIRFADLMVSPKPPHVFRAVGISRAWRAAIEPDIDHCINTFARCLYANDWPGYPSGIEELEPTPWKLKAAMEAELAAEMEEDE